MVCRIAFENEIPRHQATFQLLIEPKPREPMKHQYDYDAQTCIGFLKTCVFVVVVAAGGAAAPVAVVAVVVVAVVVVVVYRGTRTD